jgi:hypothetical protein
MHQKINEVLGVIAGEFREGGDSVRITELVTSSDVLEELVYRVAREGLGGMLYYCLKKGGALEMLGEELSRRLAQTYYHALKASLKLENDLGMVLKQMPDQDIPVVILQGMALQNEIYPEPGLRPMYDIDVWVLQPDFEAFSQLLQNCGYTPDRLYPHTFKKGDTVFDVHTHLLWADRIAARRHLLAMCQEKVYEDAEVFEVGGATAHRLNRYDQVLYLGMHALKHNVERLVWLVDIRLVLETLQADDWPRLIRRAQQLGQTRILAQVFFLLDELLQFHFPDTARQFRQANGLTSLEKWTLRRRKHQGALPRWSTLVLFSAGMGSGKWPFIWETFFPKPKVLEQVFPESARLPAWRLYLKRLFQLVSAPLRKAA